MAEYFIEGTHSVPEFWDVQLEADSQIDAEDQAVKHIEMAHPEAFDIEITGVKELTND